MLFILVRNNNFSSDKNYLVAIDFLDSIHSKTKNEHSLVKDPISRLLKIKALQQHSALNITLSA